MAGGRHRSCAVLLAVAVLAGGAPRAQATAPRDLSNFQGLFACSSSVRVGHPKGVKDVQAIVRDFPHVKGMGYGHR